jgi:hypothetical protein
MPSQEASAAGNQMAVVGKKLGMLMPVGPGVRFEQPTAERQRRGRDVDGDRRTPVPIQHVRQPAAARTDLHHHIARRHAQSAQQNPGVDQMLGERRRLAEGLAEQERRIIDRREVPLGGGVVAIGRGDNRSVFRGSSVRTRAAKGKQSELAPGVERTERGGFDARRPVEDPPHCVLQLGPRGHATVYRDAD